jgi:hypothetical protein
MILHQSEYTDQAAIGRISETLRDLQLDDVYKQEFCELVAKLALK